MAVRHEGDVTLPAPATSRISSSPVVKVRLPMWRHRR